MKNKIKIIIADDHPVFIQGLLSVLSEEESIEVIGQASDGKMALNLIKKFNPDVAVLDIQMPEPDGFQVAEICMREKFLTKIIFLTMFREESLVRKVFEVGVMGYVLKENAISELIQSIKAVHAGDTYISPQISSILLKVKDKSGEKNKEILTSSEKRILSMMGEGKSSREISEALFVSYKTIENHRGNICKKLGISGHFALVIYAIINKDKL